MYQMEEVTIEVSFIYFCVHVENRNSSTRINLKNHILDYRYGTFKGGKFGNSGNRFNRNGFNGSSNGYNRNAIAVAGGREGFGDTMHKRFN